MTEVPRTPDGDVAVVEFVCARLEKAVREPHAVREIAQLELKRAAIMAHEILAEHFGLPKKFGDMVQVSVRKIGRMEGRAE